MPRSKTWISLAATAVTATVAVAATMTLSAVPSRANETVSSASGDMIGHTKPYVTAYEDTLLDLARENGLGYVEMLAANPGVDPWVPGERTSILLPNGHILPDAERDGIVVNLAEHRLYYFSNPNAEPVTLPIGVGRDGWDTPLGQTRVVRKKAHPTWYPPASIREENPDLPRSVPPGPDNPLGTHALYFDWPGYLVHGTNVPWGVGRRVSHGCIRMYPEDIVDLFQIIDVGTRVQVIAQSIKVGWHEGELYVEAHPDPEQADEIEQKGKIEAAGESSIADVYYRVRSRAGDAALRLNWAAVRSAVKERTGVPVRVTRDAT